VKASLLQRVIPLGQEQLGAMQGGATGTDVYVTHTLVSLEDSGRLQCAGKVPSDVKQGISGQELPLARQSAGMS